MSLSKEDVVKIARLARIRVDDGRLEELAGELSGIIDWVEQLGELDTQGVQPMTSVADMTLPMREDAVSDGNCRDKVLANAPDAEDGFFTVPKVVE